MIEGECQSPRLRGYLFVGIVVFSVFPYTVLGPLIGVGSHDSWMIRRTNSLRMIGWMRDEWQMVPNMTSVAEDSIRGDCGPFDRSE